MLPRVKRPGDSRVEPRLDLAGVEPKDVAPEPPPSGQLPAPVPAENRLRAHGEPFRDLARGEEAIGHACPEHLFVLGSLL